MPAVVVEIVKGKAAKLGLSELVERAPSNATFDSAAAYLASVIAACEPQSSPSALLTTSEVARRLRVNRDKVRTWINTGKLQASNTSNGRLPRWGIKPDDLDAFLSRRTKTISTPVKHRRRLPAAETRYYPES
jgi:excisionase family DNA binding protein